MTDQDFEGKNLVQLLDMLIPPAEPAPISMWPQTQGWIWLGLGMLALCIWAVVVRVSYRRRTAYQRAALRELQNCHDDPVMVADILRRTALAAYPRSDVAGLVGKEWLDFLDRSYAGTEFLNGIGQVVARAPYAKDAPPVTGLAKLAEAWVRAQKPIGGHAQ